MKTITTESQPLLTLAYIDMAERHAEKEIPLNLDNPDDTLSHCYLAIRFLAEQVSALVIAQRGL